MTATDSYFFADPAVSTASTGSVAPATVGTPAAMASPDLRSGLLPDVHPPGSVRPDAVLARTSSLIAVASGKGGVGKTWLAITLAQALAKAGRRVLLFDGDLGLANIDVHLGLIPAQDLGAVIDGSVTLHGAVHHYMQDTQAGFSILAGRSGTGSLATLPSQRLDSLRQELMELARDYDHVVIDLATGIGRDVRQLASPANLTLVVTSDEPASLTDAYAFLKVTRATNPVADLRLVVNGVTRRQDGERSFHTLATACRNFLRFELPLAGIIRYDPQVRNAICHQIPLLNCAPTCDAARDVGELAVRLLAQDDNLRLSG